VDDLELLRVSVGVESELEGFEMFEEVLAAAICEVLQSLNRKVNLNLVLEVEHQSVNMSTSADTCHECQQFGIEVERNRLIFKFACMLKLF